MGKFLKIFWCVIYHRWRCWTVLRMRSISYIDWLNGYPEEADYYCCRCEREWTVYRPGRRPSKED